MKAHFSLFAFAIFTSIIVPTRAAVDPDVFVDIKKSAAPSNWRFGLGHAPIFGLKTEFTGLGKFASPFFPQPLGGGIDYNYDDGFVHVDSSGNIGNETWNWGYANNSQYDPTGGGSIAMSQSNSLANAHTDERDDAMSGFEFQAYYDMGTVKLLGLNDTPTRWGFRGGIHYANIKIANQNSITSDLNVLTGRFNLNGLIAPAPFTGSFFGPGPLISDSPTRSFANAGSANVTGRRELEVDLTTFNLGSYLEIPVSSKFGMMLEGGVSVAVASGRYTFVSNTTVPALGTQTTIGHDSGTKILLNLYLGMGVTYQIDSAWSVQLSGRYQLMQDFELEASGSRASLSFDAAFILSTGLTYSF
jgi:hypothetical protein